MIVWWSLGFKMQEEIITACFAWSIWMLILKPFTISKVGKGYNRYVQRSGAQLSSAIESCWWQLIAQIPPFPFSRPLTLPPPHLGAHLTSAPMLLEEAGESHYVCTEAAKPPGALVIQKHCNSRPSERWHQSSKVLTLDSISSPFPTGSEATGVSK